MTVIRSGVQIEASLTRQSPTDLDLRVSVEDAALREQLPGFDGLERVFVMVPYERFGTVNVIVNNAGVGPFGRLKDLTENDWRWIIDVNLWGVIHGVGVFLPILQSAPGGGHVVNTASMAGLRPGPNLGAYTVTKYGVVALTETLAIELEQDGSQVGATVLCPGPVHTKSRR